MINFSKKYISHSVNKNGQVHGLADHLISVSKIASNFCTNEQLKIHFYLAGLLHDFGKYQPEFQRYIQEGGRRGSVPHAALGAAFAFQYQLYEAAFAIDGHHKGLPDKADLIDDCSEYTAKESNVLSQIKEIFFNDLKITETDIKFSSIEKHKNEREILIRLLFSSLVDADWLDTEKHFDEEKFEQRKAPEFDADYLISKLEEEIKSKNKEGRINQLRNNAREFAIIKADQKIGFYSLNLPTGMGKTHTSISWALHHAKHHDLKRIIIVLPYLSIIDQTASELKRIFGDEWVLEHHSTFNDDETISNDIAIEGMNGEKYAKRLATENWDYPIIVTTSVQFFESLFSNKPSRCRRVHNIARSVVIFDEVQTLPKEIVVPTLSMLNGIKNIMETTFLFCTATQPAFEKTEKFNGIDHIEALVQNPKELFKETIRVQYIPINQYKSVDYNTLINLSINEKKSCLLIFNTKNKALTFFKELKKIAGCKIFHLSTAMYPAHRKRILQTIRQCLRNNEQIIVSSTQLVEAGVDVDFPCVFREIAPLESIIQSAGRCNREGKMSEPGNVYIFSLEDNTSPDKQYRSLAEFANSMYNGKEKLLYEHDFFSEYYRKVFELFIPEDKYQIEENRKKFNFKSVAECYRIIDSITTPIFIKCEESMQLYESIKHKPILSRADYRVMQQYSVQVYDNFLKVNISKLGREPQGYWIWYGDYNEEYGLSNENPTLIV